MAHFDRFLQLRKLEAAREIAALVANSGNKLMLDANSLLLDSTSRLFLDNGLQVTSLPFLSFPATDHEAAAAAKKSA